MNLARFTRVYSVTQVSITYMTWFTPSVLRIKQLISEYLIYCSQQHSRNKEPLLLFSQFGLIYDIVICSMYWLRNNVT